jgi:hypothetical protein
MSNPSWEGSTTISGGGEANLTLNAKGGFRLGGGLNSLLILTFNNLALILVFLPGKSTTPINK